MQPNCLHDNPALTQSGHAAGWGSHSPTCDPHLLAVILAVYGFSGEKRADSNLPTHTLELLHKQEPEFAARDKGYTFVSHQQEVGAGYFDDVTTVIQGGSSSVKALTGSTEEEQFH